MGYNHENNETNLSQISTACVRSVFVPNVTCMMDVRRRRRGTLAGRRASNYSDGSAARRVAAAESVFIRNGRVEKWASGRWFTS